MGERRSEAETGDEVTGQGIAHLKTMMVYLGRPRRHTVLMRPRSLSASRRQSCGGRGPGAEAAEETRAGRPTTKGLGVIHAFICGSTSTELKS